MRATSDGIYLYRNWQLHVVDIAELINVLGRMLCLQIYNPVDYVESRSRVYCVLYDNCQSIIIDFTE